MSVVVDTSRGRAIELRRTALGIKSIRDFEERTGVSRNAIAKAEADDPTVTERTFRRLENWLELLENQSGVTQEAAAPKVPFARAGKGVVDGDVIEFDVTGPKTAWHIRVRGPVERADQVRDQVEKLLEKVEQEDD